MSKLAGRRSGAGLLVVLMVALLGVGLWILRPSEEEAKPTAITPVPSRSAELDEAETRSLPVQRSPRRLRAEFAIFRSPPEGLPTSLTQILRKSPHSADWRLAQRLRTPQPAWAVPGKRFVCLIYQDHSGGGLAQTCAPPRRVVERGAFAATLPTSGGPITSDNRVVFGIVPDHAHEVRVRTPGFTPATARVDENTFTLRDTVTEPPEAIALVP